MEPTQELRRAAMGLHVSGPYARPPQEDEPRYTEFNMIHRVANAIESAAADHPEALDAIVEAEREYHRNMSETLALLGGRSSTTTKESQ